MTASSGLSNVNNRATLPLSRRIELDRVNQKVSQVYLYTAVGFAISFATAQLASMGGLAGKVAMLLVGSNALAASIGLLAVGIALIAAIHLTPIENTELKHALFGVYTVYEGILLSPLVLLNSTAFAAAAATTVVITGGLGVLASKIQVQFERYEKIMFIALGALALISLGAVFSTGALGAAANAINMVGGFALFSAYVIYHVQKVRDDAREGDNQNFDVIRHTMSLYLDVMNIFVRVFVFLNNNKDSD